MNKKILLLDIENQPKKIRELLGLLQQYTQVILVYANTHLSIALDDLTALSLAIQEKRLLIVKMPKTGANSADFGITFIAGRLSAQLEQGSSIDVMSNDNAMSYAVELLEQIGIQSAQIKHNLETEKQPQLAPAPLQAMHAHKPQVPVVEDKTIQNVVKHLSQNQPKKLKTLIKSLMSWCNLTEPQVEQIIEQLKSLAVISLKENKLEYHDKTIKKILSKVSTPKPAPYPAQKISIAEMQQRPHLLRIKQYCDYLAKVTANKPSKPESLANSLKAVLKFDSAAQVEQMLNLLKKHQILQINDKKVIYLQDNIQYWAKIKA